MYSAIERKAAGWAVMDADTCLSESTAGAGKGAKVRTAHAKGTCARGDKCRFSHKDSDSKPRGKGGKGFFVCASCVNFTPGFVID